MRLVQAHIALAKAEFGEILAELKRFAVAVGIAIALLLFVGILLPVGGALFLGEWLFGSIGWGVLLGTELSIAVAITAVLAVIGATGRQVAQAWLVGMVAAIVVGVVLGFDLTNRAWTQLGDNVSGNFEPSVRPLVTALSALAAVFGIGGLLVGLRASGVAGAIGGLLGGALVGALIGAFTAIAWGLQAGVGAGVAVGLVLWPVLLGMFVMRAGIDVDAIKGRFTPTQTIETTRETIEWVRKQTPLGPKS